MSDRIIQIIAAAPGWNAVYSKPDGAEFLPVICWALVEHTFTDSAYEPVTKVVPMVQGEEVPIEVCRSPRFFAVSAPFERIEDWVEDGRQHHSET